MAEALSEELLNSFKQYIQGDILIAKNVDCLLETVEKAKGGPVVVPIIENSTYKSYAFVRENLATQETKLITYLEFKGKMLQANFAEFEDKFKILNDLMGNASKYLIFQASIGLKELSDISDLGSTVVDTRNANSKLNEFAKLIKDKKITIIYQNSNTTADNILIPWVKLIKNLSRISNFSISHSAQETQEIISRPKQQEG